jgi:hypothetical protein
MTGFSPSLIGARTSVSLSNKLNAYPSETAAITKRRRFYATNPHGRFCRTVHFHYPLVADKYGQAMVVEPGENGHRISRIRNRYIVLSSFPYYQLIGKSYDEAEGDGADRFKIAHRYIKRNIGGFTIEKGMEVLKLARNKSDTYQTRCSMVFDPQKGGIYISLEANFDRIWKVNLKSQTIETHRGFASSRRQSIPATGLLASELMNW